MIPLLVPTQVSLNPLDGRLRSVAWSGRMNVYRRKTSWCLSRVSGLGRRMGVVVVKTHTQLKREMTGAGKRSSSFKRALIEFAIDGVC